MNDGLRDAIPSWRVLVGVILITVLLLVGAVALGILGLPAVADMQNSFGTVSDEETVIQTDLVINNPNPIGLNLQSVAVNYTVYMNEVYIADGDVGGVEIGTGNSSVDLESTMQNDAITDWWIRHVAAEEVSDVDVDLTVTTDRFDRNVEHTHSTTVETDILSSFESDETRPIEAEQPFVSDPILYINETAAAWGPVEENETPIDMEFLAYNPNTEPVPITRLGYDITLNEIDVGSGETEQAHVISGGTHETIPLTTGIDATTLDDWWVSHLDEDTHGHQVSQLRIEFYAVIETPAGETSRIDLDALTYEEWIGTDIFDEGGDVGHTPNGSETEDPITGDEPTDGDDDGASDDDDNESEDDDGLIDDDLSRVTPTV